MRTAVIVVSTPEILDDAIRWAKAGLVADSLWLSSEVASQIDPDAPNALVAQRLEPRRVGEPFGLAEELSQRGSLDEIRVGWIRPPVDSLSSSLKALESLLRELVPPDRLHWFDIIVPTIRTDDSVVQLPGQWVQIRIHTEDRSAPDVTDAGWDRNLDVPVHFALLAMGILGGVTHKLPWGKESAASHYEVRGFSRVVLGAADVAHYVSRFVGRQLPTASAGAAGFYPKEFLELRGADADSFVDDAVDYVLQQESGALGYRDPEPSQLQPPPNLTIWQHLVSYLRFLGFGLLLLLGKRIRPVRVSYSNYDFLDAGYNIDRSGPVRERVRIPDFDALDAEAIDRARADLSAMDRELHHRPPRVAPNIWRILTRLATSVNDGGIRPEGWAPVDRQGRKPVLRAADVQPSAPDLATAEEIPELTAARTAAVVAAAVAAASATRHQPFASFDQRSLVISTAQTLVDSSNARENRRLLEQLDALSVPSDAASARSLLDRLAAAVCGATLRSRLDVDRWSEFATAPGADDPLDWGGATRVFRKRTMIGSAVCCAIAIAWAIVAYLLRDEMPTWLGATVGFVVVALVFVAFLLWSVYVFYQVYNAFLERGRRRLEVRLIWLQRAQAAMVQNARLRAAGPALHRWIDMLAALFPSDDDVIASIGREMPDDAPKGIAVGVPVFEDREITEWLRDEAAVPGWRARALDEMIADGLRMASGDAMKVLVDDDGLAGGPLFDTWERRAALWTSYADSLRRGVSVDVAGHFVDPPDRELRVLTPKYRQDRPVTYRDFAAEPWPAEGEDDTRWDEGLDFTVRDRLGAGRSGEVSLAGDVCAVALRIQFRRLAVAELPEEISKDRDELDPEEY